MQSGVVGEAVTVGSCLPAGAHGRHSDAAKHRLEGFRQSLPWTESLYRLEAQVHSKSAVTLLGEPGRQKVSRLGCAPFRGDGGGELEGILQA